MYPLVNPANAPDLRACIAALGIAAAHLEDALEPASRAGAAVLDVIQHAGGGLDAAVDALDSMLRATEGAGAESGGGG